MKKYEYTLKGIDQTIRDNYGNQSAKAAKAYLEELNSMGDKGWELVSVSEPDGFHLFKREKKYMGASNV